MTGLRARQKADRHQRILQAAAELFRSSGYEGAKIEAIAALAEVSIGTIYNYYENKGDLLVAIVAMEVNEVLNAGRLVIENPPADVAKAETGEVEAHERYRQAADRARDRRDPNG